MLWIYSCNELLSLFILFFKYVFILKYAMKQLTDTPSERLYK